MAYHCPSDVWTTPPWATPVPGRPPTVTAWLSTTRPSHTPPADCGVSDVDRHSTSWRMPPDGHSIMKT